MKIVKIAEYLDTVENEKDPAVSIGRGIALIHRDYPDIAQLILDALNVHHETGNFDFILDVQKKVMGILFDKSPFSIDGYDTNLIVGDPREHIMGAFRRIKFHRNKGLDQVEWPDTVPELMTKLREFVNQKKVEKEEEKQRYELERAQNMTEKEWQEFEERLKNHDWAYQYSDDHSIWKAGSDNWDKIAYLGKYLKQVDLPRVTEIFNRYKSN